MGQPVDEDFGFRGRHEASGPLGVPATNAELQTQSCGPRRRSRTGKTWVTSNRMGFDTQSYLGNWVLDGVLETMGPSKRLLDIGCGFGGTVVRALGTGAEVVANDTSEDHLLWCRREAPGSARDRLYLMGGRFPEIDFPADSFDAVLAHRVLHFLDGESIASGLLAIRRWLKPGGLVGVVMMAAAHGQFRDDFLPEYEEARRAGARWPGQWLDVAKALPDQAYALPERLHVMEPVELGRLMEEAGFRVVRCDYVAMPGLGHAERRDGREHAGAIAGLI